MALYELQAAKLGAIQGRGYAFLKRNNMKESYKGVFFAGEEDAQQLEPLLGEEPVTFTGVIYKKNRSGAVVQKVDTVQVDVSNLISVHAGERADFSVIEEE